MKRFSALVTLAGGILVAGSLCEAQTTHTRTAYPAVYANDEWSHFSEKTTLSEHLYTTPDKTPIPLVARDAEGHYEGHTHNYFALYYRYWTFIIEQLPVSALIQSERLWRVLIAYNNKRNIATFNEEQEHATLTGFAGKYPARYLSNVDMANGALVPYGIVKDSDLQRYDITRFTEMQMLWFLAKFSTSFNSMIWSFISPYGSTLPAGANPDYMIGEFLSQHEAAELPFMPLAIPPKTYTPKAAVTPPSSSYAHLFSNSHPKTSQLYAEVPPPFVSEWVSLAPNLLPVTQFLGTLIHRENETLYSYSTTDVYALLYNHWLFAFCRIASNDPTSSHSGSYRLIAKRYNAKQTLSVNNFIVELTDNAPFLDHLNPTGSTSASTLQNASGFVRITDAADYIVQHYDITKLDITRLLYLIARYGNHGEKWNEAVGDNLWKYYLSPGLTLDEFLNFYSFDENSSVFSLRPPSSHWPSAPFIPIK
jgi:hypothetical protein